MKTFPYKAVIVLGLLALTLIFGYIAGGSNNQEEKQARLERDVKVNKLLVDWVYGHSERVSRETCQQIVDTCLKTDKPLLMIALIRTESEFVPTVVSNKGAMGLTQVMFFHHGKDLIAQGILKDKRELFNINTSIRAGNYVFSKMLESNKGDVTKTLTQYLGGNNSAYLHKILSDVANLYLIMQGV